MSEINAQLNAPNGAGGFDIIHPQTNLGMVSDMSAFMRLLSVAADATAARTQLGVKELTPPNLLEALHTYGNNYVPSDTSNAGWNALGFCSIYYDTEGKIKNQPSQYGQLINLPALGTTESTQIWLNQLDGRLMTRRGKQDVPINDQPFSDSSGGGIIAQSLQQNGWAKFANGLIIQWVRDDDHIYVEQDNISYNFPISFPNACIFCGGLGWGKNMYGGGYQGGAVNSFNSTGFHYIGGDNGGSNMMAFALGY